MKKINHTILVVIFLTLNFCSEQESSPEKINNCLELADAIEEVFDTIQIEAYESEIYRAYSGLDATKLDYVYEALRINKIGIDGLEKIISEYEINNEYLAGLIEGFYNNFEDSREAIKH